MILRLRPDDELSASNASWLENALSAEVAIVCNGLLRIDKRLEVTAGATGLEPAAFRVAGRQMALGESPTSRKSENSCINTVFYGGPGWT